MSSVSPGLSDLPTVVHLRPTNFFGGPEKQILEHCALLPGRGWSPVIMCFVDSTYGPELLERAGSRGIRTEAIAARSSFDPRIIGRLSARLRDLGAALLVTHGYKADIVGFHACRAAGLPMVACVRGFTGENRRIRAYEAIDRFYLRRVGTVVAVSHGSGRDLESIGIARHRLHIVPNAIDVPEDPPLPAALRREFSIPDVARLIVAAGRLSPEKGQDVLIEALARLVDAGARIHLVILGTGSWKDDLVRHAEKRHVGDYVHFAGFRRDVMSCFAAADLVVNPSHTEGMPNVVLEGMAVGAPVMATAVGGVPEVIEDGRTGWTVAPGSPEAMAERIAAALDDESLRQAVGEAGRAAIRQNHTFDRQADRWIALYESALGRSPEPPSAAI